MRHHIFLSEVCWSEAETTKHLQQLNQSEQQQAANYNHPSRLRAFVASRLLIKKALNLLNNSQQDWLFSKQQGRLIINHPNNNWHISLSHTNDYVACLLSNQVHCGLDLEQVIYHPRFMAIAQRFFSADEYCYLQQLTEDHAFFCFLDWWTRKEACIKAWHVGIAHHLAAIEFSPEQLAPINFPTTYPSLQLQTISTKDWQLACAVTDDNAEWSIEYLCL